MPELNLDFGDGTLKTSGNAGGSNDGAQDITGGAPKDNDADITTKDNNNNGSNSNDGTDNNDNNQGNQNKGNDDNNGNGDDTNSSTGGLEPGTIIEFGSKLNSFKKFAKSSIACFL